MPDGVFVHGMALDRAALRRPSDAMTVQATKIIRAQIDAPARADIEPVTEFAPVIS